MELFGSSGTRGVANEALTPGFVLRVTQAVGTVWGADRVAVARDTRTTGPMLASAAASGLASVGSDVERLGVLPTPGLQAHADREGVPAVMVTASHNPAQYNGLKLIGPGGDELTLPELETVEAVYEEDRAEPVPWDAVGDVRSVEGGRREYVEAVLGAVDRDAIADAALTVALDPGHGAGALTSPDVFRELGCRVVTVNAQPDGHFPGRNPEPVAEELDDLRRLVRAADADLGIAHDGDADRAIFVDETGAYREGDATFAALAAAELGAGDALVSAVNVSQRLVDVAEAAGARLELTPIGSTRILSRVRELEDAGESVPIAGEGNGGVVFPAYRYARDGAYTAARFLELLARRDAPASRVVGEHDGYHNVRANIAYDDAADREALLEAAADYADRTDGEVTTIDGYRIDFGDAWVLARPSGTEPLVRVYAEARDRDRAHALAEDLRTRLEAAREG